MQDKLLSEVKAWSETSHEVRRQTPGGMACNFLDIMLCNSPFLACSGREEQDDGFL